MSFVKNVDGTLELLGRLTLSQSQKRTKASHLVYFYPKT